MKKLLILLGFSSVVTLQGFAQSNNYPVTGSPTVYDYSPMLFLQRNTNIGGFIEGIQTRLADGTDNWYYGVLGNGNWAVSKGDYQNSKLVVDVIGNVGIGTGSPVSPLHVSGGSPMFAGWNKTSTLQGLYPVQIFNSNATKWAGIGYDYSTALRFWVNATSDDISGTGLNALSILNNGNVSIGSYDPQGYKLAVNGTIHAKEVKVDLTGWPDYVFKGDYTLIPLKEVKTYIDQNHHLPDIPSEQQVSKEGVNLGEMNSKLLKKIEELTLYMIEKEQQLIDQQKINRNLEERLKQVEQRVILNK
jgi:hypothetical protein